MMFDWFKSKPIELPKQEDTWKTVSAPMNGNFDFDKLIVTATTDGAIRVDMNGTVLTVHGDTRHRFLEKIQKAVQMADVADPDNEPLNKVLK